MLFVRSEKEWHRVYEDISAAMEHHSSTITETTDEDKRKMLIEEIRKVCK